jgi:tRNA threonylcarbamoyladenosine biosynthesis protein TsaB
VNVLGFDTSTPATSACLLRSDGEAFEHHPAEQGEPAHAGELMPALAELLERSGLDWPQLDALAVGVGPGTFTGLRIGIATARALAMARDLELRPVSSLAALAEGIPDDGPVLSLIDAKRGQLFAALYEQGEQRWAPFVAAPTEVAARVKGAGLTPRAAGDGAVRFREVLETAGIRVEPDASPAHAVRALYVCRLAPRVRATPPEALLPEYLRDPDAKPRSQ